MLNVSSTGCNNEWQSFAKLSYSTIDNVSTNLLPAGSQNFFQVLNVSNASFFSVLLIKSFKVLRFDCLEGSSFYHSKRFQSFSTRNKQINGLSSLVNRCDFIFTSTTSAMTSHRILITSEYINAYIFCLLICLCAKSVKGVMLCKFSKNRLKGWIVQFILHHPV